MELPAPLFLLHAMVEPATSLLHCPSFKFLHRQRSGPHPELLRSGSRRRQERCRTSSPVATKGAATASTTRWAPCLPPLPNQFVVSPSPLCYRQLNTSPPVVPSRRHDRRALGREAEASGKRAGRTGPLVAGSWARFGPSARAEFLYFIFEFSF
jgi:hypothetical protein